MDQERTIQRDVVVLGGGIVGLLTALLVAEETTYNVCLFSDDAPEPRTDSQRNHAWLQSGLLYVGADIVAARHMYHAGREMHTHLGFRFPSERGVFRYDSEEAAIPFLEHARAIGLTNQVRRLTEREAMRSLGSFFAEGRANFEVPDCPFDIAGLMTAARERARACGVSFRVDRVKVEPAPHSPNGYQLRTSQEVVEPQFAVVCAGSATPLILDRLGVPHPLVINRSSLLVLPSGDGMSAPLLADRSREVSVVRHNAIRPAGRLVVGDRGRALVDPVDGLTRVLTSDERDRLLACVPPDLNRPGIRATACHKTDCRRQDGKATVDYWVESFPQYPGLVFATPGKATMALHTAKLVLAEIKKSIKRDNGPYSAEPYTPPGEEWREPILTHFHPAFDGIDDTQGYKEAS